MLSARMGQVFLVLHALPTRAAPVADHEVELVAAHARRLPGREVGPRVALKPMQVHGCCPV